MKVKQLEFGQYFQCEDIIARLLGETIVFLNSKLILHNQPSCCDTIDDWKEEDVIPLDFQAAVLLLVKECLENNDIVPECDPNNKVDPKTLKPGQFFLTKLGVVGLIFDNDRACYLNSSYTGCWDYLTSIQPVVPLTMHQAVLSLAQTLVGNTLTVSRIKIIGSSLPHDYYLKKELEFYQEYQYQYQGRYYK